MACCWAFITFITVMYITDAQLVPDVMRQTIASGFTVPVAARLFPDEERVLVVEQSGTLHIIDLLTGTTNMYMAINNVDAVGERGLLDCIFDTDFATSNHLFCYYSPTNPQGMRISRFVHNENSGGGTSRGLTASEFVVWSSDQPYVRVSSSGAIRM